MCHHSVFHLPAPAPPALGAWDTGKLLHGHRRCFLSGYGGTEAIQWGLGLVTQIKGMQWICLWAPGFFHPEAMFVCAD